MNSRPLAKPVCRRCFASGREISHNPRANSFQRSTAFQKSCPEFFHKITGWSGLTCKSCNLVILYLCTKLRRGIESNEDERARQCSRKSLEISGQIYEGRIDCAGRPHHSRPRG